MALIKSKERGTAFPALRNDLLEIFDMDRFFNQPSLLRSPFGSSDLYARVPATNVRDTDKEYVLELAVPGLDKKDFHVDIDNNQLEIRVEKEEERKKEEEDYTRREYNYSSFYRSFTLPESVNADKIQAEYKNGILQVHLPKVPEAKRKAVKEISVK